MMRISSKGLVCLVLLMLVSSLTHVARAGSNAQTLFTSQTPALPNVQVGPHELGTEFTSTVSGQITAIRFWKSSSETGQHVGHIWSASGQLLASATFASETASGWQQQSLPSPLAIAANTVYVVSVNTGGIYYAATTSGLTSSVVNQNLSTVVGNNGLYGTPGQFPTQSYSHSNYFRDVVFSPDPTLFTTQTPTLPNVQVGPHELGTEFKTSVSGQITAIRFWKSGSETGQHVGHIWSASGQLLASATFASETASGWQQQSLPSPLAIAANTVYVVSVNTGGIYYAATTSGLTSSVVNQNLSTVVGNNGLYGTPGQFPTQSYSHSNYFRDVVFSAGSSLPPAGGTGQQQISVVPASVSFGGVTVGVTNTQTVTVSNPGGANLSVSQASVSGSGFALKGLTLPLTITPGQSAAFTVSFTPTAASAAAGSLTLVSNAPTSPTTVALSGSGTAASVQLTASPTTLSFGNVNVGSSSSQTVTLSNTGNSNVSISQLSASGAGFSASGLTAPLNLSPGQSTSFSVNFAPTTTGSVTGSVSVASNATNSPTRIALTGSGLQPSTPTGPLAAFPGAQGGGALSVGGRGGVVIEVTNLNDNGPGSLRQCAEVASGPRTCVFRVSGTIALTSNLGIDGTSAITITNPYVTIAGQTAPGGGIQVIAPNSIAGSTLFRIQTHDVIIRYMRLRHGFDSLDNPPASGSQGISAVYNAYNIIVDHCSMAWTDEVLIAAYNPGTYQDRNQTYSWNILADALANHPVGGLINAASQAGSAAMTDIDWIHNLFETSGHRNPLSNGANSRFVNNIVYNWYYFASLSGNGAVMDYVNNKYVAGPMTPAPGTASSWEITATNLSCATCGPVGTPVIYMNGNVGPNDPNASNNAANMFRKDDNFGPGNISIAPSSWVASSPQAPPSGGIAITADPVSSLDTTINTIGAYRKLNDVACDGGWINNQDSTDQLFITRYLNRTGPTTGQLNGNGYEPVTQADDGGFPTLAGGTSCTSSLHDGIADQWKINHGLSTTDTTLYQKTAPNGYTYLENYLNGTDPNVTASTFSTTSRSLWANSFAPNTKTRSFRKENSLDGTRHSRWVSMNSFDLGGFPWLAPNARTSAAGITP